MRAIADRLLASVADAPIVVPGMEIYPLGDARWIDADVLIPSAGQDLAHIASEPVSEDRSVEAVANLGHDNLLLLQGQELAVEGRRFETLAPALLPPHHVTLVEARGSAEERRDASMAEDLMAAMAAADWPVDAIGYLACVTGRLVRLELFPGRLFCRAHHAWAIGSVAGLASATGIAASRPEALLRRLARAAQGGWERVLGGGLRLGAEGRPGLRGAAILHEDRPIYLDLADLPGSAMDPVLPRPRRPLRRAAAALPLPD